MTNYKIAFRTFVLIIATLFAFRFTALSQNYFAGTGAGTGNTGVNVTGVGFNVLNTANSGGWNTGFGYMALKTNSTGSENTAVGAAALKNNSTGIQNVAIGTFALSSNNTGKFNSAGGYASLQANTSGINNTAFGYSTLFRNTTGADNTAFGMNALQANLTGLKNAAIGSQSLYNNTTGHDNIGVGFSSVWHNTTGSSNIGIGTNALYNSFTGSSNIAMGFNSMVNVVAGANESTALGNSSMSIPGAFTGSVAVGAGALGVYGGFDCNVTNSVFIGKNSGLVAIDPGNLANVTVDNSIAIGYNVTLNTSNKVIIGNTAITSIGGQVGWTVFSDRRLKTNINKSTLGLDFILALNPVTYNYKAEGQKGIVYTGLIAQEVDVAAKKAGVDFSGVDKNGEYWGIRYAELTVPLIKSMQEIHEQVQTENAALKKENEELKNRMQKIEASIAAMQKADLQGINVSTTLLFQNHPNPFNQETTIAYRLSPADKDAVIVIRDINGNLKKQVLLSKFGNGTITVSVNELLSGTYTYSLVVKGVVADTKLMVITK